jgi:ABC-2 type transport system permease protein
VRVYWELAWVGFHRYATYRGAAFAGVFTNTVFGFILASVMIALFTVRPHIGGYDLQDAVTYIWLTQGLLMTVYIWGWVELAQRIRTGDVITDLQRPVDFQGYWLAQDLGRAAFHAIFRGIPPFLVGALAFPLRLPARPLTWIAFAVSVGLAVCLSFGLRFAANVLAFWILDYRGVNVMAMAAWTLLSGMIVPIAIFPPWLKTVATALPFSGMVQSPSTVFLEKAEGLGVLLTLLSQLGWALVLLAAGRWLLAVATRRLVIQGG